MTAVNTKKYSFNLVDVPKVLLPILKDRLPRSCGLYNETLTCESFKTDKKFYTLEPEIHLNSWIILVWNREDYGPSVDISAPLAIIDGKEDIPDEIRDNFAFNHVIDWDDRLLFPWLERPISAMIYNINVNIKGNVVAVHPHYLFYMDIETALGLEIKHDPSIEFGRIRPENDLDFIISNWAYAKHGSEATLKKCLAAAASGGVFIDGKCVSGAVTVGGMPCALYTDKDHRNKGYGKVTMLYAFKELAKDGCVPCSTVEVKNVRSIKFHESLGVKTASFVDWMVVQKINID